MILTFRVGSMSLDVAEMKSRMWSCRYHKGSEGGKDHCEKLAKNISIFDCHICRLYEENPLD